MEREVERMGSWDLTVDFGGSLCGCLLVCFSGSLATASVRDPLFFLISSPVLGTCRLGDAGCLGGLFWGEESTPFCELCKLDCGRPLDSLTEGGVWRSVPSDVSGYVSLGGVVAHGRVGAVVGVVCNETTGVEACTFRPSGCGVEDDVAVSGGLADCDDIEEGTPSEAVAFEC